jgi:cell division septation protein DedD
VQVGAFSDLGNAERARDRLRRAGETVVIIEGPGGLHRVRVGPFSKRSEAEDALRRLRHDYPPAALVDCG